MRGFFVELAATFFSAAFKTGARLACMLLFMAFYFSRYFPTEDLLIVASFFLASFGLWKVFDCLDSKIDILLKRFEE